MKERILFILTLMATILTLALGYQYIRSNQIQMVEDFREAKEQYEELIEREPVKQTPLSSYEQFAEEHNWSKNDTQVQEEARGIQPHDIVTWSGTVEDMWHGFAGDDLYTISVLTENEYHFFIVIQMEQEEALRISKGHKITATGRPEPVIGMDKCWTLVDATLVQ
jgi:hypothetical protein